MCVCQLPLQGLSLAKTTDILSRWEGVWSRGSSCSKARKQSALLPPWFVRAVLKALLLDAGGFFYSH